MPRHLLSLNDNLWQFGYVPRRSFTASDVYDLPDVNEWLPATVPGNVRTDLLALGRIPDPFFGENYQQSLWVEDVDWWYRRQIKIDPLCAGQRAFLIFEGIDYLSAVFVNGQEKTRHEGMFSRQTIEISEALRGGSAEVAVRLWGSGALPRRQLTLFQKLWQAIAGPIYGGWAGIYPDRSATLKCQMSFGWDFAPPIRTMGIWDEATLVRCGPVFIETVKVTGQLPDRQPAQLSLQLGLSCLPAQSTQIEVWVKPTNFEGTSFGPFKFSRDLPAGASRHHFKIELPRVALWQPWDRGHPHLYEVKLTVQTPNGEMLDQTAVRTGFRQVELHNWQFSLNGQREFIRGLNWVPADSFPGRVDRNDYAKLLDLAKQSGANLLRVWGGGLREKRAFYELCDELGLLVWQEFPFACLFLGSYPTGRSYLTKVSAECSAIVNQISHHPAIIVWCGGNEFSRRRNRPLLHTLATVVTEQDGSRPFIPVSPSFDQGGDAHGWQVWHGEAPLAAYQTETAHFVSEFGLQALPQIETLQAILPDPATGWATHHADCPKLERYAGLFGDEEAGQESNFSSASSKSMTADGGPPTAEKIFSTIRKHPAHHDSATTRTDRKFLPTSQSPNLPSFIAQSQRAQATALQTAIEHMRRRKGVAGGACLWQFNEPWPAISWAIIDYYGRPKLAYERLADWYNPILISLRYPLGRRWQAGDLFEAEIWVCNDTLATWPDCDLAINLDGGMIYQQPVSLGADTVSQVGQLSHRLTKAPAQLGLTLYDQDRLLAGNTYDLTWQDLPRSLVHLRLRRRIADWVLH